MDCADQHPVYDPTTSACTNLQTIVGIAKEYKYIGLNSHQYATTWQSDPRDQPGINLQHRLEHGPVISTCQQLSCPVYRQHLTGQLIADRGPWLVRNFARGHQLAVEWTANDADLGPYGYIVVPDRLPRTL